MAAKTKKVVFYGPSGAYEYGDYKFEKNGHSVEVPEEVAEELFATWGENFEEASSEVIQAEEKDAAARERLAKAQEKAQAKHDAAEQDAADKREAFYLGHLSDDVPAEYAEPEGDGAATPNDDVAVPEAKSAANSEVRNDEPVSDKDKEE